MLGISENTNWQKTCIKQVEPKFRPNKWVFVFRLWNISHEIVEFNWKLSYYYYYYYYYWLLHSCLIHPPLTSTVIAASTSDLTCHPLTFCSQALMWAVTNLENWPPMCQPVIPGTRAIIKLQLKVILTLIDTPTYTIYMTWYNLLFLANASFFKLSGDLTEVERKVNSSKQVSCNLVTWWIHNVLL